MFFPQIIVTPYYSIIFLAFFESLSFFDSAENGRSSFLPEALRRDKYIIFLQIL